MRIDFREIAARSNFTQLSEIEEQILQKGVPALNRLAKLADDPERGALIGGFLLSLYKGKVIQLNVSALGLLKQETFDDCVDVLVMVTRVNSNNPHRLGLETLLENGYVRFEKWYRSYEDAIKQVRR